MAFHFHATVNAENKYVTSAPTSQTTLPTILPISTLPDGAPFLPSATFGSKNAAHNTHTSQNAIPRYTPPSQVFGHKVSLLASVVLPFNLSSLVRMATQRAAFPRPPSSQGLHCQQPQRASQFSKCLFLFFELDHQPVLADVVFAFLCYCTMSTVGSMLKQVMERDKPDSCIWRWCNKHVQRIVWCLQFELCMCAVTCRNSPWCLT